MTRLPQIHILSSRQGHCNQALCGSQWIGKSIHVSILLQVYRSKIQVSVRYPICPTIFFWGPFSNKPQATHDSPSNTEKVNLYTTNEAKKKKKTRPPASAWHSNQKSRSTRPNRKSRSASKQHHDYPCESSTERTSGNKLPSMWQLAWAHFG